MISTPRRLSWASKTLSQVKKKKSLTCVRLADGRTGRGGDELLGVGTVHTGPVFE